MRLALREARKGLGRTSPNPCVGAVVVQDDTVVSCGYHKKAGTPHAEIHALRKAGDRARGATIYVTLEPCNHTGRTPPCSHAVAAAGIRRVVVGMQDPNPLVRGSGNQYLREQGIEVAVGVLERECRDLNLPFFKHITFGMPFVVMKAGMSLDGRISYQQGQPGWMTGECSSKKVHGLRNTLDAILVGRGTITVDNPSLTTRLPDKRGRDPVRVILDSRLQLSLESKILHLASPAPTILFCSPSADEKKKKLLSAMNNVLVHRVDCDEDGGLDLRAVLVCLGEMGICSLLVEGGATVHGSFLRKGLVDRVFLFIAPLFAGSSGTPLVSGLPIGGRNEALALRNLHYSRCGNDMLVQGDLFDPFL
ncbi:MAG: bifunctional diaminohydroxyphosphoribosylaminopyrimidine deaminase/5-amino-6-(5-phosphoribosylamino)uracil reductase RibD [Proteobacteria bacterium]|nr:bifunctional diaminohydroxyphosphoribosylaminopyrimidine deaminase/5-amino-6-(5-phosphoribosylamino)uracil reductase RibD [Pseudomonadota bacterium]MBU1234507.1 bifunctional diaminohydroxyphosphoribosylaminopyrimidine deaminase/5-amino-6-(5-phosphoribosylamino)uracil reductase RibD [Pseudomonadota bacterium]MBU1417965.1 bifunctional diaminohydroxyphosphoribosylaminopyrimidine deaminase/5-amino-6-(5-phosphoribosylamino)uracil reductase RibD [Pseudomonadota bacterium]MBU1453560.1 bifunctional d